MSRTSALSLCFLLSPSPSHFSRSIHAHSLIPSFSLFLSLFPFLSFRLGRVVIFRKVSTRVRPTAETCIRVAIVRLEMITYCTLEQTYDGGSSSSLRVFAPRNLGGREEEEEEEEEEAGIGVSQPIWMTKGGRIPVVNASYLNLARGSRQWFSPCLLRAYSVALVFSVFVVFQGRERLSMYKGRRI